MRYIKSFETEAAFEAGKGDLSIPYVAYTQDDEKVHYARSVEDTYDIIGTLANSATTFTFSINGNSVTPNFYQKDNKYKFGCVWTGGTVTSLRLAFNNKSELLSIDRFNVTVTSNVDTYRIFYDCRNLESVGNMFDGFTSIEEGAFFHGYKLTGIDIPNTVASIGRTAFAYCSGMTEVVLPSSITFLDKQAFVECNHLTSVTCLATTPPSMSLNVFQNTNNCPIYVPAASVETYKSAAGWSDYSSRILAVPST